MEVTETILDAMVREIRNGAAVAAQDLSKGVVPIVLVFALVAPAYWIGGKVTDVQKQLSASATATAALATQLDKLTPLVNDVANANARIETLTREIERLERDRALTESRLRALDKDLTERIQRLELQR